MTKTIDLTKRELRVLCNALCARQLLIDDQIGKRVRNRRTVSAAIRQDQEDNRALYARVVCLTIKKG